MTIITDYKLPKSAETLSDAKSAPFFLAFLASKDPNTNRPWCPDVVAALPVLEKTFTGDDTPRVGFVEVGQRPEWRDKQNFARVNWNVQSVPTLVRFEEVEGKVRETGRLVEGEILDEMRLQGLLSGRT